MISENEVGQLIDNEIPALSAKLSLIHTEKALYKIVACLTDYTKDMIREHRSEEVVQCFHTAHELLQDGSTLVKLAIVNIYINSVSRLLECSFYPERSVRIEFLKNFGREYSQLIYACKP